MIRLFQLLRRFNFLILFVFLEILAFMYLLSSNNYHHSIFFNSVQEVSGQFHRAYFNTVRYLDLRRINDSLLVENAKLRSALDAHEYKINEKHNFDTNAHYGFVYKPAHVINNSIRNRKNYMTLDIGSGKNIEPLMGVISYDGIVGIVKNVSPNFSLAISVLNTDFRVNAKIAETGEVGSVVWNGVGPGMVMLRDIPNHVELTKGQEVVVGPYSSMFPENYPIGKIVDFKLIKGGSFFEISVKLHSDIRNNTSVYVIRKILIEEQVELENQSEE